MTLQTYATTRKNNIERQGDVACDQKVKALVFNVSNGDLDDETSRGTCRERGTWTGEWCNGWLSEWEEN